MSLGVVMLVHTAFKRAEQVARHWANAGCPVVIHVDRNVVAKSYKAFVAALADVDHIRFSRRYRCEWGTWGIVAASQTASEKMLRDFPDVQHVYLASGSCLPLRPIEELIDYLAARPRTDFIESATTMDVPWTVGGLDQERFTLHFPFSWRRHRFLFDRFVQIQRLIGTKRMIPSGLRPHMGSQWWCLTRQTLTAILQDPDRATYDDFFRRVWIPDESYYQTLARLYSRELESRSLTLSKFDFQGKPHIFYDDHLQLLRRSDCFVRAQDLAACGAALSRLPDRPRRRHEPDRTQPRQDRPHLCQGGRQADARAAGALHAFAFSQRKLGKRCHRRALLGVFRALPSCSTISSPGWRGPPARGCMATFLRRKRPSSPKGKR